MSKFNVKVKEDKHKINLAGGNAYKQTDKLEFISILLTSFVEDQFYRSTGKTLDRVTELITGLPDKKFAAQSAIFARNEFGMRSITHATAGEVAKAVKGEQWTKNFYDKVVFRVDDMIEIVSYYIEKYGKPLPNSLKKGLRKSFDKFDGYQLAKYRKDKAKYSLVDLANLLHPKPTEKNADALAKLIKGELKSTDTWETKLTQAGQKATTDKEKAELKADAWKSLIKERKIGYFALLRNLRNISEQAPELVKDACALLTDKNMIAKSKVLPFRFETAMNEVSNRDMKRALNTALDISCANVPKFDGTTLIAVDVSGSMMGRPEAISRLFAGILAKSNDADVMTFDTSAKYESYNPDDSVMTIGNKFKFRGGGTSFPLIFSTANKAYDRIIILSDMMSWSGGWGGNPEPVYKQYKSKYSCDPYLYSLDLTGYGTTEFLTDKNFQLAGFSDKIFDLMSLMEQDKNALIKKIEAIEL